MTKRVLCFSAGRRRFGLSSTVLAAAVCGLIPAHRATAATIKAHAQATPARSSVVQDWKEFQALIKKWQNEVNAAPPIKFLHKFSLSGTYNPQDLPRFLQGSTTSSKSAAQVLAQAQHIHAQSEPAPLSVTASSVSHSASAQVLSQTTTAATTPRAEAQFVPEPSAMVIGWVLLGAAIGWKRFRCLGG